MFTDMVGFTATMAEDEVMGSRMLARHQEVVESCHADHSGDLIQYFGDGTLSLFSSARQAVNCAIDMQIACGSEPVIPLRIGIHLGEIVSGSTGIYGNAVNVASRIESMAMPGSVLVSSAVVRELANQPDLDFKSHGMYNLKNVADPMQLYSVKHQALPEGTALVKSEKGSKMTQTAIKAATSAVSKEQAIAVLPFKDLSKEQDQQYFCDGISDEIMTDLSGLKDMIVIASFSSGKLATSGLSSAEIASELGAHYLVTGSVHKSQDAVRITAQVIDAELERQLWAGKVKGKLTDIFDLQEEMSTRIVASLNIKTSKDQPANRPKREIDDPRAYDAYLQARAEINKRTKESFGQAESLLQQALDIIGPNPLLISTLGHVYLSYNTLGISPDPSYQEKAEDCLQTVEQIAPDSVYTHLLGGLLHYRRGRIQEAIDDFKEVLSTDPNNQEALMYLSLQYLISGYAHYAKPLLERLISIDPLDPTLQLMPGYVRFILGDFEGAAPYYRKALDMDPDNPFVVLLYCQICSRIEPAEGLIPLLEQIEPLAEFHTFGRQAKFLKLALQGRKDEAVEAGSDPRLQYEARYDEHPSWWMTCVYSIIDEKERALEWLENTINRGFINYPLMAYMDPAMQNLRGEKRFWELMQDASERWEKIRP